MASVFSEQESATIKSCLTAVAYGDFFPDWEFSTLFGVDRTAVQAIADAWPAVNTEDKAVRDAIVNSMNHLLGYPHRNEKEWQRYIVESPQTVKRVLERLLQLGY